MQRVLAPRSLQVMELENFDVIVLGAGPAGLTIAADCVANNLKVAIIDAQDLNLRKTFACFELPKIKVKSSIGGTTRYWGGQVAYFCDHDLDRFLHSAGIPQSEARVLIDEMRDLAKLLDLPFDQNNIYHEVFKENPFLNLRSVYSTYTKSLNIANIIKIESLLENDLITLINGNIKKIQIEEGHCTGLFLSDNTFLGLKASQALCIALGTFGSTEVLMQSLPESKLKFLRPIVDHPHGYIAAFIIKRNSKLYKKTTFKIASNRFKRKFHIYSNQTHTAGIAELHFDYFGDFYPNLLNIKLGRSEKFIRKLNRVFSKVFRFAFLKPKLIWVWLQIEQSSQSQNLPSLNKNSTVDFSIGLSPPDYKVIGDFQSTFVSEIKDAGYELAWQANSSHIGETFQGAFHPSGSFPMNTSDTLSLITPYGRVNEVNNLFIASSATWPISSWVNPTFMIMVFARMVHKEIHSFLLKL